MRKNHKHDDIGHSIANAKFKQRVWLIIGITAFVIAIGIGIVQPF